MSFQRPILSSKILTRSQPPIYHGSLRRFCAHPQIREESKHSGPKITANYNRPAVPRSSSQLPVFPIIAIFLSGSGLFYLLVKQREGESKQHYQMPEHVTTNPRKSSSS
ncbi:hypothetical protein EV356DRAFT_529884 [Viridothelium virens]|uniref:Uncharacterized protein n=1 Tax=Viridothelium virens TaxID=1048519 RepID=A0A6A6HHD5_VIRVR|nr:hypothetical protein EV356DRAFT_529884 [Viridothelium virens]